VTCEQVRELLPEHLLGSLDDDQDHDVRRHLRGCSACREERAALEVGVDAFSRAVHDREPPEGLRDRVLATLVEEWADTPRVVPEVADVQAARASRRRRGSTWAVAAAIVALVLSAGAIVWGGTQAHRANLAVQDASDYRTVLHTLGGRDFRVGTLRPDGGSSVSGQVLVYDGDPAGSDRSWAMVLLRSPGGSGTATARLVADGGRTVDLPRVRFADDGDAATWMVSTSDLTPYHRLVVESPDGVTLASGALSAG
jgi:Putative zinc-finger